MSPAFDGEPSAHRHEQASMARDARDADSEASDEIAHAFDLTAEGRARWYARLERDVGLNT